MELCGTPLSPCKSWAVIATLPIRSPQSHARQATLGGTETQECSATGQWSAQGGGVLPTQARIPSGGGVCAANPCGQHGTCRESPARTARLPCACSTDFLSGDVYMGDTCQCLSSTSPCQHGTPVAVEHGTAPCTWTCDYAGSGYAGPNCETSSNHPSTGASGCNPGGIPTCKNGGTCTSFTIMGVTTNNCQCATGWTGDTCMTQTQSGTSTGGNTGTTTPGGVPDSCAAMPCLNGGTCIDVFGHASCTCAAG